MKNAGGVVLLFNFLQLLDIYTTIRYTQPFRLFCLFTFNRLWAFSTVMMFVLWFFYVMSPISLICDDRSKWNLLQQWRLRIFPCCRPWGVSWNWRSSSNLTTRSPIAWPSIAWQVAAEKVTRSSWRENVSGASSQRTSFCSSPKRPKTSCLKTIRRKPSALWTATHPRGRTGPSTRRGTRRTWSWVGRMSC